MINAKDVVKIEETYSDCGFGYAIFFFQAEDGIRDLVQSRGLGDVYKRQVGDGRPTAHTGATLLNPGTDDIAGDEFGLATARNLGRRVAQVALRLARTTKG